MNFCRAVRWEGLINQFCWTYTVGITGFGAALLAACALLTIILLYEFVVRHAVTGVALRRHLIPDSSTLVSYGLVPTSDLALFERQPLHQEGPS